MWKNLFEGWHLVILVLVIVVVFGWKRLPDAARSFGRSARILKSEMGEMKNDGKSSAANQTVNGETIRPGQEKPTGGSSAAHPDGYPQRDQNNDA